MFCHKCGGEIADDAVFCHKCGAKALVDDAIQQSSSNSIVTQKPTAEPAFKEFVNSHIRATTKFKSAEDLLKNGKPLRFVWICLGAAALIGTAAFFPFGGILTVFFGLPVAIIVGVFKRSKLFKDHPLNDEIDLNDLVNFLSINLEYLSPDFCDWGTYSDPKPDILGITRQHIRCTVKSNKLDTMIIFAQLPSGNKVYAIAADTKTKWISLIGGVIPAGRATTGFPQLRVGYYAAPILTAAVEYYLKSKGLATK